MTISKMIEQLQNLKDTYGDGPVTLQLVPGAGVARAEDVRNFEIDNVERGLAGGGAEITVFDYLWDPSWRERD